MPPTDYAGIRAAYVAKLDQLGYPSQCRNIGIACGSGSGIAQGFDAGESLVDVEIVADIFGEAFVMELNSVQGKSVNENVNYFCYGSDGEIPLNNTDNTLFATALPYDRDWFIVASTPCEYYAAKATLEWPIEADFDTAPGSTRMDLFELIDILEDEADKSDKTTLNKQELNLQPAFVHPMGALDIDWDVNDYNLNRDLSLINLVGDNLTPFDVVYLQSENLRHVEIHGPMQTWIEDKTANIATSPASATTLPNSEGDQYNYGEKYTKLESYTIESGGVLGVNLEGGTVYGEGVDNEENQTVKVTTFDCIPVEINVENRGVFQIGQISYPAITRIKSGSIVNIEEGGLLNVQYNSKFVIEEGGTLHVKSGGILRSMHNGKVIVEEGGQLILEAGAKVHLWDEANGAATIHIKNGGELVINGEFDFDGSGFFQFDGGHIFTQNAPFVLNGKGNGHRFLRLNQGASLLITEHRIELSDGQVDYENDTFIAVGGVGKAYFNNTTFTGSSNGTTGLVVASSWEVDIRACIFTGLDIGMMINGNAEFNGNTLNLPSAIVRDSYFTGNAVNVYAIQSVGFNLIRTQISGGRLGLGAFETIAVNLEDCTIKGYGQPAVNGQDPSQINSLAGAIVLDKVTTLTVKGGEIAENDTGIYGCKECQIGRIGMIEGAVIQGNRIGIEMYGGLDGWNGLNYGGLKVDCSSIIGNGEAGVLGHDILLAVESVKGSNNFDHGDSKVKIFKIRYFDYESIGNLIPAKDNMWGEDCPNPTQDYLLQNGYDGEPIRLELGNSCTEEILCGEGDGDTTPSPDDCTIRIIEPNIVQTVHEVTLIGYEQFWYKEDENAAMKTLTPVAGLPSKEGSDRLTGRCWQNVYLAQLIVKDKKGKAGYTSRDERNLTETNGTKNVSVFPNPASTDFSIDVSPGNYSIEIFNTLGQPLIQQRISETTNIQTHDWKSGVYFIRVFDNLTQQFFEEKLVVK